MATDGHMNTDKASPLIRVYLFLSVALFSSSCGRYANFTLPPLPGGDASLTFRFLAEPEPVLTRGAFHDALNPSIAGNINLYSVHDGQWHTALATTQDKVHWQPQGIVLRAPANSYIAANGSTLLHERQYW